MTNPLENQGQSMFLFRRFTSGNNRRLGATRFDWVAPQDPDYFWLMHDYYGRLTLSEIMKKRGCRGS